VNPNAVKRHTETDQTDRESELMTGRNLHTSAKAIRRGLANQSKGRKEAASRGKTTPSSR